MPIEELIYKRLKDDMALSNLFADFGKEPAIFYSKGTYDSDAEMFYPHIILDVERFSDALHDVAGFLMVDIFCSATSICTEDIERIVRKSLENVFFKSQEVFILNWSKSESFQERASESTPLIVGMTVTFEIRELPNGIISTPSPVQALQEWAQHFEEFVVIGLTDFGEIFEPTREKPALWISQTNLKLLEEQARTAFVSADINFHVFAPSVAIRREWLTELYHALIFSKAIQLSDGSPMRLESCTFDFSASPLQGQIKTNYEFGILARKTYAHPLNKVITEHSGKIKSYSNYLRR